MTIKSSNKIKEDKLNQNMMRVGGGVGNGEEESDDGWDD